MTATDQPYSTIGTDVMGTVARLIKVPTISTSDTLTFSDFSSILAITLYKVSDMTTALAFSLATNVATLTTSTITGISVVGIVTGVLKK